MKRLTYILFLCLLLPVFWACAKDDDIMIIPETSLLLSPGDTVEDSLYNDSIQNNDSLQASDTVYSEEGKEDKIRIEYYMAQQPSTPSLQGAAVYGDLLFQCEDKHQRLTIYNLKEKIYVGEVALKYNKNYHDNQAMFGNVFYEDDDEFPLLYISQTLPAAQNILVYRILKVDSIFSAKLVQDIRMPDDTEENNLFHFNIVLDGKGHFYLYSRNRTTSIGQISKWQLPDPHAGDVVIEEDQVLDRFPLTFSLGDAQGGTMLDNKIFFVQGVPSRSALELHIVDVETHEVQTFNLRDYSFTREPESLNFYDNHFVISTNRTGIYSLYLTGVY